MITATVEDKAVANDENSMRWLVQIRNTMVNFFIEQPQHPLTLTNSCGSSLPANACERKRVITRRARKNLGCFCFISKLQID
jgi:hypothetical protein